MSNKPLLKCNSDFTIDNSNIDGCDQGLPVDVDHNVKRESHTKNFDENDICTASFKSKPRKNPKTIFDDENTVKKVKSILT